MKIVFPDVSDVFDTNGRFINTLIIEKQSLLTEICLDINNQIQGLEGKTVISKDNKLLDVSKTVELLTQFTPFEINRKIILNKVLSRAENIANGPDYFEETMSELSNLERYLWRISDNLEGNIVFSKLTISSILKSIGMEFEDDYKSLGEKIIDYMDLVRFYDKNKIFIFVNLRSFIDDSECNDLFDTILRKQLDVVFIDNCEHTCFENEKRYIVDSDSCEIK